ncbi:MAG: hydroxymethylglutaryl-CoA reductase, degradative [Candidatus Diapherotrites archaeon]|nr:hydroxymethylglutaryl-CoA reductase, degradative [Candidatus Diapherotrites archaeon]
MSDLIKNSRMSGFGRLSREEKIQKVAEFADLTEEEVNLLNDQADNVLFEKLQRMQENTVSLSPEPFSIVPNGRINGEEKLVVMRGEEPSVVASCGLIFSWAREGNNGQGILAEYINDLMIGQIQQYGFKDEEDALKSKELLLENKESLINIANKVDPVLVKFGGGARDLEVRKIDSEIGQMLVTHLKVDCQDAMGANTVNQMCEVLTPYIEDLTRHKVGHRILSNLADERRSTASLEIPIDEIKKKADRDGLNMSVDEIEERLMNAYYFAKNDNYRATTYNKGAMNAIDTVGAATGQDVQAIEAGVHSFAGKGDSYKPITEWKIEKDLIKGKIDVPMAVGIVGGSTKINPMAQIAKKIMGVKTAKDLGEIIVSAGLAQNFAAIRALALEGIQKGHMKLHAQIAATEAGAEGEEVEKVVQMMVEQNATTPTDARKFLAELRAERE